jgi:hypothetical protein
LVGICSGFLRALFLSAQACFFLTKTKLDQNSTKTQPKQGQQIQRKKVLPALFFCCKGHAEAKFSIAGFLTAEAKLYKIRALACCGKTIGQQGASFLTSL